MTRNRARALVCDELGHGVPGAVGADTAALADGAVRRATSAGVGTPVGSTVIDERSRSARGRADAVAVRRRMVAPCATIRRALNCSTVQLVRCQPSQT